MPLVEPRSTDVDAAQLHANAVVIDALTTSRLTSEQASRMRAGGVTATNHTAANFAHHFDDAVVDIVNTRRQIAAQPNDFLLIEQVADLDRANASGIPGVMLGLQNALPIEDRLQYADVLYALGIRIVQLTYNDRNFVGDGCTEPDNAGLSVFGRSLVSHLNELGILIDLSHCGYQTTTDAILASNAPVAITHANPLTLSPSPRNKPDEVIKLLGERDGFLGVCVWSPLAHRNRNQRPQLSDILDFIDYIVELIGVDHVGIGTDHGEGVYTQDAWDAKWGPKGLYPSVTGTLGEWYGFHARYAEGLDSATLFPNLTAGLLDRGYSPDDVLKIVGGNFRRLLTNVWK
ncbi:MAG: membrane dipeptidase [Thermomicrobiales bacterium]|nr:membrane dipeptidase [Thermomicrobiales bacterium]MCO5220639.1 dipeptidase [Thermomicrobiales bacterium]